MSPGGVFTFASRRGEHLEECGFVGEAGVIAKIGCADRGCNPLLKRERVIARGSGCVGDYPVLFVLLRLRST